MDGLASIFGFTGTVSADGLSPAGNTHEFPDLLSLLSGAAAGGEAPENPTKHLSELFSTVQSQLEDFDDRLQELSVAQIAAFQPFLSTTPTIDATVVEQASGPFTLEGSEGQPTAHESLKQLLTVISGHDATPPATADSPVRRTLPQTHQPPEPDFLPQEQPLQAGTNFVVEVSPVPPLPPTQDVADLSTVPEPVEVDSNLDIPQPDFSIPNESAQTYVVPLQGYIESLESDPVGERDTGQGIDFRRSPIDFAPPPVFLADPPADAEIVTQPVITDRLTPSASAVVDPVAPPITTAAAPLVSETSPPQQPVASTQNPATATPTLVAPVSPGTASDNTQSADVTAPEPVNAEVVTDSYEANDLPVADTNRTAGTFVSEESVEVSAEQPGDRPSPAPTEVAPAEPNVEPDVLPETETASEPDELPELPEEPREISASPPRVTAPVATTPAASQILNAATQQSLVIAQASPRSLGPSRETDRGPVTSTETASNPLDFVSPVDAAGVSETSPPPSDVVPDFNISATESRTLNIQVLTAIVERLSTVQADPDSITLRLDPPELGELEIQFRHSEDGVHVRVEAQDAVTMEMLVSRGHEIDRLLRTYDFDISRVDFGTEDSGAANSDRSGTDQRNFQSEQEARGDQRQPFGSAAGQNSGRQSSIRTRPPDVRHRIRA